MKRIYLDYAAATPVDPEAARAMKPYFSEHFGNPGSVHAYGQEAIAALDNARETIARLMDADFREIIFTASATEANNIAIAGAVRAFRAARNARPRIIISAIEHESVLETARACEREGAELVVVPVDRTGRVDEKFLKENLTESTAIVSVMYVNNEIGTVEPVADIAAAILAFRAGKGAAAGKAAADRFPLFHTDAAQAFSFFDCGAGRLGADLITLSSHKMFGPKGAGALYIKKGAPLAPLIFGGGQEFGFRSGTENVPAVIGFAKAAELAAGAREGERTRIAYLRDTLSRGIKNAFPRAELNGPENESQRSPHILNVHFPWISAEVLIAKCDLAGLAVSSGSACRSRALEASYVIEALGGAFGGILGGGSGTGEAGTSAARAKESIRFSFGRTTTEDEIRDAVKIIAACLS